MPTKSEAWINGLWQSSIYSIPELFGVEPPAQVRQWRVDNPVAGFMSTMVGGEIPYVGWYAAAKRIKRFDQMIEGIGAAKMAQKPIRYSVLRETARFAPFEAGRLIANQAFGDVSFGEMLSRSAIDLALNATVVGGVTGIGKAVESGALKPRVKETFDPPQLQLRTNDLELPNVPAEKLPTFTARMDELSKQVRDEEVDPGVRYVAGLAGGKDTKDLELLFKPTGVRTKGDMMVLKPIADKNARHYKRDEEWLQEFGKAGLAKDFDRFTMYPRVVRPKTMEAAARVEDTLEKSLVKVNRDTFMGIEPDEQFGFVAKRIPGGQDDLGGWVLAKTDTLDWFDKKAAQTLTVTADDAKWVRQTQKSQTAGFIGDGARDLKARLPLRALALAFPKGRLYASFDRVAAMSGLKKYGSAIKDLEEVRDIVGVVNKYFTPRQFQFRGSQTATMINGVAQAVMDRARHLADEIAYGAYKASTGRSVFAQTIADTQNKARGGGPAQALDNLTDDELNQVDSMIKQQIAPAALDAQVVKGNLTNAGKDALMQMNAARNRLGQEEEFVKAFYETNTRKPSGNHYLVPKKWALDQGPKQRGWNRRQFIDKMEDTIRGRTQGMANVVLDHETAELMRKLQVDDPRRFEAMNDRLKDLKGQARKFESRQNEMINKLVPFLGKNGASDIAYAMNRFMYPMTLGFFVPANAIMNVVSVFTHTMPELLSVFGSSGLRPGLMSYLPAVGADGKPIGTVGVLNTLKVMLSSGRKLFGSLSHEDVPFWTQAVNEGVINPRFIAEAVGSDSATGRGIVQRLRQGDYVGVIEQTAGFLTNSSEQLSRTWAFQAALDVGRAAGLEGDALYQAAKTITNRSMFGYAQADKAAFMTTPLGSVMGQFKNWSLHTMLMMANYGGEAIKYGSWKPFLWQQAAIASFGGLAASPLINVAEAFNSMFSDENLMYNMYDMMEKEDADALFFGLPTYLGGALTASATAPFTDPMRDISSFFMPVVSDRVMAIANTAGAAFDHLKANGLTNITDIPESEEIQRGLWQIFAPRAFQRIFQTVQNDAIVSMSSGYPIAQDASLGDKIMYAAGIPPTEITRRNYQADILYRNAEQRRAVLGSLGQSYMQAMEAGDSVKMWQILKAGQEHGINADSIARSAAARSKKGQQDLAERAANVATRYKTFGMVGLE